MKINKSGLKNIIKLQQLAITQKCLDCVCFQPKEIPRCEISNCPLWKFKPKQLHGVYTLKKRMKKEELEIPRG